MRAPRASEELKTRALKLLAEGLTWAVVAQRVGRHQSTIRAWADAATKTQPDCKKANG